ncbi:hypothetical protein [Streptodolium elevatio]|uniref:Uncharacterized protein n=1 Tax=Streptodolium elevatio TaxID=3157996 RepID=A0ABV3DG48_9ACTN
MPIRRTVISAAATLTAAAGLLAVPATAQAQSRAEVAPLGQTCGVTASTGSLSCWNSAPTSVRSSPYATDSWQVDVLRTTWSWFGCYTIGEFHGGGTKTWYGTVGDDTGQWGFVPASAVSTSWAFDLNPGQYGMKHC